MPAESEGNMPMLANPLPSSCVTLSKGLTAFYIYYTCMPTFIFHRYYNGENMKIFTLNSKPLTKPSFFCFVLLIILAPVFLA